jgi:hypothetical protein
MGVDQQKRMTKNPTVYKIVPLRDGTYAVQAEPGRAVPLMISGFKTEGEARAWIETMLYEERDSEGP